MGAAEELDSTRVGGGRGIPEEEESLEVGVAFASESEEAPEGRPPPWVCAI